MALKVLYILSKASDKSKWTIFHTSSKKRFVHFSKTIDEWNRYRVRF